MALVYTVRLAQCRFGESMMKKAVIILASVGALAVTSLSVPSPAEARAYRHRHHSGYALYYDYSHGSTLSATGYVYPAANWGPFFHRVRHSGPVPVVPYQPAAW
jgi:hypothetical protein